MLIWCCDSSLVSKITELGSTELGSETGGDSVCARLMLREQFGKHANLVILYVQVYS